ncbi:MAG: Lrp/AsnC family transcriptional regulator [Candidatus Thorarchaeota archaeon]
MRIAVTAPSEKQQFYPFKERLEQFCDWQLVDVVITAFIMAKVESAKARDVLNSVRDLEEVEEAHLVYGAYDLLIKGAFKTPESLSSFVVDSLRKVDGVKDTVTNVCAAYE